MFKLFSASLIIAAACAFATAQGSASRDKNEPPSLGVAPKSENGVGRADVRVFDEAGNPTRNANVKLESTRSDGFFCCKSKAPAAGIGEAAPTATCRASFPHCAIRRAMTQARSSSLACKRIRPGSAGSLRASLPPLRSVQDAHRRCRRARPRLAARRRGSPAPGR